MFFLWPRANLLLPPSTLFIPAHQLSPFPPSSTDASASPAFPTITQGITLFPSFPLSILPVSVTQEPLLHLTATVLDGLPSPGCEKVCSNMRNTSCCSRASKPILSPP